MTGMVLFTIVEISLVLICLKSGWLISLMSSLPWIDNVADLVEGYFGITGTGILPLGEQVFAENLLKSLICALLFRVIGKLVSYFLDIAKREQCSDFRRAATAPLKMISIPILTAIATAFIMEMVYKKLINFFSDYSLGIRILLAVITAFLLIGGFFIMKMLVWEYCLWVLLTIIVPGVIKILAVEFMVIFLYYLLNIPGMLEQVGSISVILVGMLCCVCSLIGAGFFEDRIGKQFGSSGKRYL